MKLATVHLKAEKEKSLRRLHPWVFSGAIERVSPVRGREMMPGDTVAIHGANGDWLASAAWSPSSQIRARVWSFKQGEDVNEAFFLTRLQAAAERRQTQRNAGLLNSDAYRLCAGESDGLPGVTIDVYGQWAVVQLLSAGADAWRQAIVAALRSVLPDHFLYERSDVDVRKKEGLALQSGPLDESPEPPEQLDITENGVKLYVDIKNGHKTGYYLDQRDNRLAIQRYVKDKEVLNAFSYTGGFGLFALAAGAKKVINLDVSQHALDLATANVELNDLPLEGLENINVDVFQQLRDYHANGRKFDVIVLDPPKFVDSKASLMSACRGYKDINRLAASLLKPGGVLFTFSCSGLLSTELFQKVVADAALDAKRPLQIVERLHQSADHPVLLSYPEGLYLKGFILS